MKKNFTLILVTCCSHFMYAQLNIQCSGSDRHSIYLVSPTIGYYRVDSVDTSPTEPILVAGETLGANGISINNNLDSLTLPVTMYSTVGGYYYYWDQTQWVNTNHTAGGANGNAGGTDSYIFSLVPSTGTIYRYDGTADAVPLFSGLNTQSASVYDIATDRNGNYYIFFTTANQVVMFDVNAAPLDTFTTSGNPSGAQIGFAILGSRMYLVGINTIYEGIISISAHTITFSLVKTFASSYNIADIATCPDAADPLEVFTYPPPLQFTVYPNPITSSSTLQFKYPLKNTEVIICDVLGKEKIHKIFSGNRIEIEKGNLSRGVYFVQVKNNEVKYVQKIIIE